MKRKIKLKLTKEQISSISNALGESIIENQESILNGEIPNEKKTRIVADLGCINKMYFILETLKLQKKSKKYWKVKELLK